MFQFVAQELLDAESKGERVWLLGHVLSGWDGSNPLPNPTGKQPRLPDRAILRSLTIADLFYQIVDRFSPHVIAGVFFGHTHEDQFFIYYSNNGTTQDAAHAVNVGWMGKSFGDNGLLMTGLGRSQ